MNIRALGIDISDSGTDLVFYSVGEAMSFPTAICKVKEKDEWCVGEEAYKKLLSGTGVITDRLLTLTAKHKTATLDGIKYKGKEILKKYLQHIIDLAVSQLDIGYPEEIVVSIQKVEAELVHQIISCFVELGYLKSHVHVISRCESFIYYTMNQGKEIWNNQVGLFHLSEHELTYFELRVQRGYKTAMVMAELEETDENFDLNILRTTTGAKLGDQIVYSLAQRVLQRKLFSAVILSGKGFENLEWAENFVRYVCNRRKVFFDEHLFATGACYRAVEFASPKPLHHFTCICDGRLRSSVHINVVNNSKESAFALASAGESWYTLEKQLRVIADNMSDLELSITPVDMRKKKTVKIPLDFIPKRPAKTMRLDLKTMFKDSKTMIIDIKDAGFGEIIPSSQAHFVKEVDLWD